MSRERELLESCRVYFYHTGLMQDLGEEIRVCLAEQPELNLSCKSVQHRLATQWGYVKKETIGQGDYVLGEGSEYFDVSQEQDEEPIGQLHPNGWFELFKDLPALWTFPIELYPAPRKHFARLSEQEISEMAGKCFIRREAGQYVIPYGTTDFARAIEDALEEKIRINKSNPNSVDLQSKCRGDKE